MSGKTSPERKGVKVNSIYADSTHLHNSYNQAVAVPMGSGELTPLEIL